VAPMAPNKKIAMFALLVVIAVGAISCGGGSSAAPPVGTTVTVNFDGAPAAVAVQMGSGTWTAASLQGSKLTFTLPAGESRYAVAYVCPLNQVLNSETVMEATTQDSSPKGGCLLGPLGTQAGNPMNTGAATGAVDASAIPGASSVRIYGRLGVGFVAGVKGPFNVQMQQGTDDIAFVAGSLSRSVLAVKILRLQTVPGAVNNGQTVVFAPSDETSYQAVSVTNIPTGFTVLGPTVYYGTSNGTSFSVGPLFSVVPPLPSSQYAVVPPSEGQANDKYLFSASDIRSQNPPAVGSQSAFINMIAASATPVTLPLPPPLLYSPPTPAASPSFNVAYTGFAVSTYSVALQWSSSDGSSNRLTVSATPDYQAGESTMNVPDLVNLAGFLPRPPSGTTVTWTVILPRNKPQPTDPTEEVENDGAYTEP